MSVCQSNVHQAESMEWSSDLSWFQWICNALSNNFWMVTWVHIALYICIGVQKPQEQGVQLLQVKALSEAYTLYGYF